MKENSRNYGDFFKIMIYVMGGRCDYQPLTPKAELRFGVAVQLAGIILTLPHTSKPNGPCDLLLQWADTVGPVPGLDSAEEDILFLATFSLTSVREKSDLGKKDSAEGSVKWRKLDV